MASFPKTLTLGGEQFDIIKSLGKGGMGEVALANRKKDDKKFAIKRIFKEICDTKVYLLCHFAYVPIHFLESFT